MRAVLNFQVGQGGGVCEGRGWRFRALKALWFVGCWLPLCARAETSILVDLDKNPNLTGIFESGLRPLNVPGLENWQCEVRPAQEVAFKAGGVVTPAYLAAWEFSFNAAGRIVRITGYSEEAWTVGEAYLMMAPMEEVLGGNPRKMLEFLEGYPRTSVNGDMWGNRFRGADGLRIGYYFRHSMQTIRPFLATFYIDWNLRDFEYLPGEKRLTAPPGYESFDMNDLSNGGHHVSVAGVKGMTRRERPGWAGGGVAKLQDRGFFAGWWLVFGLIVGVGWVVRKFERRWIRGSGKVEGGN